jgi:hypothetical protein
MQLEKGTVVRFTAEWLAKLTPAEAKRFTNREGVISGYRMGASEPIVTFPRSGRFKEVKLFEVLVRNLEVLPEPTTATKPDQG